MLSTELGDASLERHGEVLVCRDPRCFQWRPEARMTGSRLQHPAVLLDDGRVLVVGGGVRPETFDPDLDLWRPSPPAGSIRAVPTAVRLPDGRVVISGGADRDWRVVGSVEIFDPATGEWREVQPMSGRRLAHTMSVLPDGSVLVTGGTTSVLAEPFVGQATVERFRSPEQSEPARRPSGRVVP